MSYRAPAVLEMFMSTGFALSCLIEGPIGWAHEEVAVEHSCYYQQGRDGPQKDCPSSGGTVRP